ncbi:MAG: DUF2752 domain-containing protein [Bacteroidales bacterium]|jgi:hypothetical protein
MELTRRKLYALLSVALLAGYIWFFYDLAVDPEGADNSPGVCLFKSVTGIPCPSCGSTRAIIALFHGDVVKSLSLNPIGLLLAMIMTVTPFWLIYDFLTHKKTLLDRYRQAEAILRKPIVAFPLIILVILNWIWNISKGI